uniref:Uncharacterized protein n=1 Tax=Nelumbo nucifera TaxID=4432 RepID=A0A822ZW15_NELNU|nr:TPA_asm: hypothetical protein HUJ06_017023 [Nelumbo nucifera]
MLKTWPTKAGPPRFGVELRPAILTVEGNLEAPEDMPFIAEAEEKELLSFECGEEEQTAAIEGEGNGGGREFANRNGTHMAEEVENGRDESSQREAEAVVVVIVVAL